jgi:hypothetical protein
VTDGVEQATEVVAARARLIGFVGRCRDEQWTARPLAVADPRAVGVIVDHVADAYEYLGSFVTKLARNEHVDVSPEIVDELNAHHASAMSSPSPEQVIAHLMRSGDAFVALVEPLTRASCRRATVTSPSPGSLRSRRVTPTPIGPSSRSPSASELCRSWAGPRHNPPISGSWRTSRERRGGDCGVESPRSRPARRRSW